LVREFVMKGAFIHLRWMKAPFITNAAAD